MTSTQAAQYAACQEQARAIVAAYRAQCPPDCDPQNSYALVAGAVISAVGAGVSAYGQHQSGKAAAMIADYNAYQQELNARMQMMTLKAEAAIQKKAAKIQFYLRSQEAQAAFNNARTTENVALGQSAAARVAIRNKQGDFQRLQATQRATIAASGLDETSGTPLDILAETAGQMQLQRENALYADEINRRTLFREAEMQHFGGELTLAQASADRDIAMAQSHLTLATAQAGFQQGLANASITRLTGQAQKTSANWQAAGTAISGVGSAVGGMAKGG